MQEGTPTEVVQQVIESTSTPPADVPKNRKLSEAERELLAKSNKRVQALGALTEAEGNLIIATERFSKAKSELGTAEQEHRKCTALHGQAVERLKNLL